MVRDERPRSPLAGAFIFAAILAVGKFVDDIDWKVLSSLSPASTLITKAPVENQKPAP